jgi:hypothetical protein
MFQVMTRDSLFPELASKVPDDEVIDALRDAIARAGRLSRSADMLLCCVCARFLVDEMHGAGLEIVRTPMRRGR